MKKIGIVGGMGPEATLYYYRMLVDLSREVMGSELPEIIIYSVKNIVISQASLPEANKVETVNSLVAVIKSLSLAGADFAIIACNTAHRYFNDIKVKSPIPLLSIVEETAKEVKNQGLKRVGLMGSLTTMSSHYYQDVFNKLNISIVVPEKDEQEFIKDKLLNEIVMGIMQDDTRNEFIKITRRMIKELSIEALILGCTELPLLLTKEHEKHLGIPLFDTSKIHVQSALRYCLSEN